MNKDNELKRQVRNIEDSASRLERAHVIGNLSFMHALGEKHFDENVEKLEDSILEEVKSENTCKPIQEIIDKLFGAIRR